MGPGGDGAGSLRGGLRGPGGPRTPRPRGGGHGACGLAVGGLGWADPVPPDSAFLAERTLELPVPAAERGLWAGTRRARTEGFDLSRRFPAPRGAGKEPGAEGHGGPGKTRVGRRGGRSGRECRGPARSGAGGGGAGEGGAPARKSPVRREPVWTGTGRGG